MESPTRGTRDLAPHERNRLEAAAQVVIESARSSYSARSRDNSTGINWQRLATTTIDENYLSQYPGCSNQEIALRETLEEVERRIVYGHLDLVHIDNAELQGTIEDVLNDILDFMVPDAQASSSDTDSSGSDDSDQDSDSDGPPNSDQEDDDSDRSQSSESDSDDSSDAHQGQRNERPHEASRYRPHYLVDPDGPSTSILVEGHTSVPESSAHGSETNILRGQPQSEESLSGTIASSPGEGSGGGKEAKVAICCSTM